MTERLDILPPDLSVQQIRDIGDRATKENETALAKAMEIIAKSRDAIERADEILSETSRSKLAPLGSNNAAACRDMTKLPVNPILPGAGHPKTAAPAVDQPDRDHAELEIETNLKRKLPSNKNKTEEQG